MLLMLIAAALIAVVAFAWSVVISCPDRALILQGVQKQDAAMKRRRFLALGVLVLADEVFE
jgi:hypothetical protein